MHRQGNVKRQTDARKSLQAAIGPQFNLRVFEDVAVDDSLCSRLGARDEKAVRGGGGLLTGGTGLPLGGLFAMAGAFWPGSNLGLARSRPADLDAAVSMPWSGADSGLAAVADCAGL